MWPLKNSYPIVVTIYHRRVNGSYEKEFDRCGKKKERITKHEYYQLKRTKNKFNPPPFDYLYKTNKGTALDLLSPASGQYYPLRLEETMRTIETEVLDERMVDAVDKKGRPFKKKEVVPVKKKAREYVIRPIDTNLVNMLLFTVDRLNLRYPRKESLWIKYFPIMLLLALGIMQVLPWVFGAEYVAAMSQANSMAANTLKEIYTLWAQIQGASAAVPPV